MPQAEQQVTVTVIVLVEGQEAMRGQATIPPYKRASIEDHIVQGTVRSAALRALSTTPLLNTHQVWDRLHSVWQVGEERRQIAELEASGADIED